MAYNKLCYFNTKKKIKIKKKKIKKKIKTNIKIYSLEQLLVFLKNEHG